MFTAKLLLRPPVSSVYAGLAAFFLLLVSPQLRGGITFTKPDADDSNPLLKESSLDFHYPPFDQIKDEHYEPAYKRGMAEELKEIEAIAANKDKPTFDNTIVALDDPAELWLESTTFSRT